MSKRTKNTNNNGLTTPEAVNPRLALAELKRHNSETQQKILTSEGEELAKHLYHLTNIKRETDANAYLKLLNQALLDKTSAENLLVLNTAKTYFTAKYGAEIQRRGEIPELLDQVLHRTGKTAKHQLTLLIKGFDVNDLAHSVWQAEFSNDESTQKDLRSEIDLLTSQQVKELAAVYSTIPAKETASLILELSNLTTIEGTPYADVKEIAYILQGRSTTELDMISAEIATLDGSSQNLAGYLSERLSPTDYQQLAPLLSGFQPTQLATKLYDILQNSPEPSETLDKSIDINPHFAGRFRRRYEDTPVWLRELKSWENLSTAMEFVTAEQFQAVNRELHQAHGATLAAILYRCNQPLNPRRIALKLYQSVYSTEPIQIVSDPRALCSPEELAELESHYDLENQYQREEFETLLLHKAIEHSLPACRQKVLAALRPIEYLNVVEIYQVRNAYQYIFGRKFELDIAERLKFICGGFTPPNLLPVIRNRLTGIGRILFNFDFFRLLSSQADGGSRKNEISHIEKSNDAARYLKGIIDLSKTPADRAERLLTLLKDKQVPDLERLEKAFYQLDNRQQPLLPVLQQHFEESTVAQVAQLLAGNHPQQLAKRIKEQPARLITLLGEEPEVIAALGIYYQQQEHQTLEQVAKTTFNEQGQIHKQLLALSTAFAPAALQLYRQACFSHESINTDYFISNITSNPLAVAALEFSFNYHFSGAAKSIRPVSLNFLEMLRRLATDSRLTRSIFVRTIARLEGLQPELAPRLYGLLHESAITADHLNQIKTLLSIDRDKIFLLSKLYNALDDQQTLRDALNHLPTTLRQRNKLILLLDGFIVDSIADHIHAHCQNQQNDSLAREIYDLLTTPEAHGIQIPKDPNWAPEMYNQIRHAFKERHGLRLLEVLRKYGATTKTPGFNSIAFAIYGESSKQAIDLKRLLDQSRRDPLGTAPEAAVNLLAKHTPLERERIIDMFNAYFGPIGNDNFLLERLAMTVSQSKVRDELNTLVSKALQAI